VFPHYYKAQKNVLKLPGLIDRKQKYITKIIRSKWGIYPDQQEDGGFTSEPKSHNSRFGSIDDNVYALSSS
jgi:hypothetical protein